MDSALACLFGFQIARVTKEPEARTIQVPAQPAVVQTTGTTQNQDVQQALRRSQEQVASLEQQVAASGDRLKQADVAVAGVEKQLAAEQSARKQLSEESERLTQQLSAAQAELDSMRNKWASAGTDVAQQATHTAALETEVRELKASLDEKDTALSEKDRMLALDKDFLAHDRDIRDLIGARNLYIADIFDTNENGKTAKQFGRIFYTRERLLIFYGFDLEARLATSKMCLFRFGEAAATSQPSESRPLLPGRYPQAMGVAVQRRQDPGASGYGLRDRRAAGWKPQTDRQTALAGLSAN